MRTTHEEVLEGHRPTDAQRFFHHFPGGPETAFFLPEVELRAPRRQEIEHGQAGDHFCQAAAQRRAGDAHVQDINKEVIEHYVHDAHPNAQDAGHLHVTAGLQDGRAGPVHNHGGHEQRHNKEVAGGVRGNVIAAAQPVGQERGDAHAHNGQEQAEAQHAHQRLPQDGTGAAEIIGAHQVRYLHREAAGDGHTKAAKEP